MKAPLSWLKDYVEIDLPIGELAHLVTMAGMEPRIMMSFRIEN